MFSKLITATFVILFFCFASNAQIPTPTPVEDDKPEKVFAEEIKLNVSAYDLNGNFVSDVKKEDLVISEDGRLNQAISLRRIPANVLVVLDTGGEIRGAKRFKDTIAAARNLINALQTDDLVAIMDYHDKVEVVAEWTNKNEAVKLLDSKTNFGRRSVFINALAAATSFLQKTPRDNRHLVLITDGTDTFNNASERRAAMQKLLATDINAHVISYTLLEKAAIAPRTGKYRKGEPKPQRLPEEVIIALPKEQQAMLRMPRLGSVISDKEFLRKMKERSDALTESETYLIALSKDTNGYLILPESRDEMLEKSANIAGIIDSSYVLTYVPKRALSESPNGEIRNIAVTSRRPNLRVQANRKLIVKSEK